MASPRGSQVALSTSYLVSEQTPSRWAKAIEFSLDDDSMAFTVRLTFQNGNNMERTIAAGADWYFPPVGGSRPLGSFTWNAKSASGTPNINVTEYR